MSKCFCSRLSPSKTNVEVLMTRHHVVGKHRPRSFTQSTSALLGGRPSQVPRQSLLRVLRRDSQKKHERHLQTRLVPKTKSPSIQSE